MYETDFGLRGAGGRSKLPSRRTDTKPITSTAGTPSLTAPVAADAAASTERGYTILPVFGAPGAPIGPTPSRPPLLVGGMVALDRKPLGQKYASKTKLITSTPIYDFNNFTIDITSVYLSNGPSRRSFCTTSSVVAGVIACKHRIQAPEYAVLFSHLCMVMDPYDHHIPAKNLNLHIKLFPRVNHIALAAPDRL